MDIRTRGHTDPQYRTYRPLQESIRHYYGDIVRQLFVAGSVMMIVAAPLYAESFAVQMPLVVLGVLAVVGLAAFTNPHNKTVMALNVVVSAAVIVLYEVWALWGYRAGAPVALILREAVVVIFLGGFYFAAKTLRAMLMGQIGKEPTPDEFASTDAVRSKDPSDELEASLVATRRGARPASIEDGGVIRDALGDPAPPDSDKLD